MSDGAAGPVRRSGVALAIVTAAFSAMLLSANLATPLYAVWARQFGFSTAVLALIFAVYAVVLVPALLTFGQLSDRLGRRVVIAIGLGIAAVALLLCGVLARWAPAPEVEPFAAGMIICALAATGLLFVPETAERQRGGLRIRRPRVPAEIRAAVQD